MTEKNNDKTTDKANDKIKTRQGSGYLKQLYSTAKVSADSTHSGLKGLTTFLVNFVPVDKVDASELQVRTHFDDAEIAALSHSIKEHGVLQPILVVQDGDRYKVIAGERRLRASKLAGVERIPARIVNSSDKGVHEIALRENLDRVDLHPIEEGEGYVSLLDAKAYVSHDAIAKAFGKPKSRITECIGFTKLPVETKNELLNLGLKGRSFLRTLLTTPVDQHPLLISDAAKKEDFSDEEIGKASLNAQKSPSKTKKENIGFAFQFSESKIKIPGFQWKVGEGYDRLDQLLIELKKLVEEIETLPRK